MSIDSRLRGASTCRNPSGFRGNEVRYIFAVCALLSLAIWHIVAIPFIIVAYVAVSLAVRAACFRKS